MNGFAWWVVQNAAATALLIPLVWLACRLRRSRPAEQHLLWLLLLLKFVTPPVVVWPWPAETLRHWNESTQVTTGIPRESEVSFSEASGSGEGEAPAEPPPAFGADSWDRGSAGAAPSPVPEPVQKSGRRSSEPPPIDLSPASEVVTASDAVPLDLPAAPPAEGVPSEMLPDATTAPERQNGWLALTWAVVAFWLTGAAVVCVRTVAQVRQQRRALRSAWECPAGLNSAVAETARGLALRTPRVLISEQIDAPFVSCLGNPVLVWPASLTGEDSLANCRGVLAHELAHIRRRDHWVVRLEALAAPLWWWDPVFWFVRRRLDETRELACDALAVESSRSDRRALADLLLAFSTSGRPAPSFASLRTGIASSHSLRRRLAMLFDQSVSGRVSPAGVALTGLLAAAAVPGWAWSQEEAPATATAEQSIRVSEVPQAVTEPSAAVPASGVAETATPPTSATDLPAVPPAGVSASEPVTDSAPQLSLSPPAVESPPATPATPAAAQPQLPHYEVVREIGLGGSKTLRLVGGHAGSVLLLQVMDDGKLLRTEIVNKFVVAEPADPAATVRGHGTGLLFFTAPGVGPAQRMLPIIQKIDDVPVEIIDIDQRPEVAKRFAVYNLPMVIAIKDSKEVGRVWGLQSAGELRTFVEKLKSTKSKSMPPAAANQQSDTGTKLLKNALELALLDVEEKQVQLENGKQRHARQQKLFESGRAVQPPGDDVRLLEIELKRAQLRAEQARVQLEAATTGAADPFGVLPAPVPPASAGDARLSSLEAALELAQLEVEEKRVLLEQAKQEEATWQNLFNKGVVSAGDRPFSPRLAEIELKKAQLKAAQAKAALEAARSAAPRGR
jgi:beta-lactamase regulating signal transducer with metallopeptidase domain/thioredoxin-like negative regulator of GroEL